MLSLLQFLLASTFVLGCFANFAGNDYGSSIVLASASFFALSLIASLFNQIKKAWSGSKVKLISDILELFSLVPAIVGIVFKFNHWPSASVLMVTGIFLLVIVFLVKLGASFYFLFQKRNVLIHLQSMLQILFCMFSASGFVFKFQHWPGAGLLAFLSGIFVLLCLCLIVVNFNNKKQVKLKVAETVVQSNAFPYIFLFFSVVTIHYWGINFGIFPPFFHSNRPLSTQNLYDSPDESDKNAYSIEVMSENDMLFWMIANERNLEKPNDTVIKNLEQEFILNTYQESLEVN